MVVNGESVGIAPTVAGDCYAPAVFAIAKTERTVEDAGPYITEKIATPACGLVRNDNKIIDFFIGSFMFFLYFFLDIDRWER